MEMGSHLGTGCRWGTRGNLGRAVYYMREVNRDSERNVSLKKNLEKRRGSLRLSRILIISVLKRNRISNAEYLR